MFHNPVLTVLAITSKAARLPKKAHTRVSQGRVRHQEKVAWNRHEAEQDLMDATGL